jgi:type I restriction enzyme, S subunit
MLREKWQEKVLGDLITLLYGAGLPESSRSGSGFPVYGSSGIIGQHTDYLVNVPGIVVGRKGTVGAVAWSEGPFWPIDTAYYVVANSEVEIRWCYWLLQGIGLDRLDSSTGVPGLNRNDAYSIRTTFPSLPEQHRIAEILDTIDEAIQKTEALISKLKAMKQGLLHDLLTRGLDKNGKLRDPKAHPEQFKDSLLGRIPKDWGINPLEKLAEVDRGKFTHRPRNDPRFYGGAYPFVQTGDIAEAEGDILKKYSQTLNNSGSAVSREFPENTIAITIAANIADTAILGQPMYFPDSIVGAIVRLPNNVRYVELCIRRAKRILNAHAPQSAQKNINLEDLRPLLIPTPTSEEQNRIGDMYDVYSNHVQSEEQYREKLKLQKKGLMHDLLTGKVRVQI